MVMMMRQKATEGEEMVGVEVAGAVAGGVHPQEVEVLYAVEVDDLDEVQIPLALMTVSWRDFVVTGNRLSMLLDIDDPPVPPPPRSRTRIAGPSSRPSSSKRQSTKPPSGRTSQMSMAMVVDDPLCDCGVPAAKRTAMKETASKGRQFWTCGNNGLCSLFRWVEDVPSVSNTRATIPVKRPYLAVSAL